MQKVYNQEQKSRLKYNLSNIIQIATKENRTFFFIAIRGRCVGFLSFLSIDKKKA